MMRNKTNLAIAEDEGESSLNILREVYEKAHVVRSGKHLTTVNELCDQIPALRPETLKAAVELALQFGTFGANKILTEEDKGAPIAAAVSLAANLPLCVARWYRYEIPGQVKVDMESEYYSGSLYLNGINGGDKILLIDDTLSTGGTMVALIEAVKKAGADVVGAVAIIEKVDNEGHDFVWIKTGVDVKTCMKIHVTETGVEFV
ncbi:MAG: phosphoribosyltransferase family protein [Alphaproteobacteria bacterium]|nr:phosphoribosyltransferase family protein [Alphaproteobacteria bacterium]